MRTYLDIGLNKSRYQSINLSKGFYVKTAFLDNER